MNLKRHVTSLCSTPIHCSLETDSPPGACPSQPGGVDGQLPTAAPQVLHASATSANRPPPSGCHHLTRPRPYAKRRSQPCHGRDGGRCPGQRRDPPCGRHGRRHAPPHVKRREGDSDAADATNSTTMSSRHAGMAAGAAGRPRVYLASGGSSDGDRRHGERRLGSHLPVATGVSLRDCTPCSGHHACTPDATQQHRTFTPKSLAVPPTPSDHLCCSSSRPTPKTSSLAGPSRSAALSRMRVIHSTAKSLPTLLATSLLRSGRYPATAAVAAASAHSPPFLNHRRLVSSAGSGTRGVGGGVSIIERGQLPAHG